MEIVKSKRITILPITNIGKLNIINTIMNNNLISKNSISKKFNDNDYYQNLLFEGKNKELNSISKTFKENHLFAWEIQKFINDDLITKEKERLERRIKYFKPKVFIKKGKKNYRKQTNITKLITKLILFEYFKYRLKRNHKIIIGIKSEIIEIIKKYNLSKIKKIFKTKNFLINQIKYHKKQINYTTGSIFKTGQRELGLKPRIIKDETNKLYKYWYCFDYRQDGKKKTINLPLAYNLNYHKNLKSYTNAIETNKFNKNKNKDKTKKRKRIKSIFKIKDNLKVENLLNVNHTISFSKNKQRLTITLTHKANYKPSKLKTKHIGIDVGGGIDNTLAISDDRLIGFKHIKKIIKKLNKVDKLPNNTLKDRKEKGYKLAKVLRENTYNVNKEISTFLKDCKKKKINNIIMEDLSVIAFKGKKKNLRNKNLDEKFNRIFKLLRSSGLVELFRKQARNMGIKVHTVPAYYTSKWCHKCNTIHDDNRKGKKFKCVNCGHTDDADINAAKNIEIIFKRFLNDFCVVNDFGEYSVKKYLKKDLIKVILTKTGSIED